MRTLLKMYGLNSDMQYFELLVRTIKTRPKTDAKILFNDMPRKQRKCFIVSIYEGVWNCGLNSEQKAFFMNLI